MTGQSSHVEAGSALARRPSEYELASARLSYSAERECSVQTKVTAWYGARGAACTLRCADWERFRDPRATTHARYVELQRAQEASADALLDPIGEDYELGLSAAWVGVLDRVFAPLRFPAHGLQMLASYLGATAPCGRLAITGLLQAADENRRIERLAYRLAQLRRGHPRCGKSSRALWEQDPAWQPMRELIERLLAVHDWGEAFVAVNAVVKPAFDELFMLDFARLAAVSDDPLLARLLLSLHEDCAWHRQWSAALIAMLVQEDATNAHRMASWVELWAPRTAAAVDALIALMNRLIADTDASGHVPTPGGSGAASTAYWTALGLAAASGEPEDAP